MAGVVRGIDFATTQPADELRFPTFGLACTPPAGWRIGPEVGPFQIARWGRWDVRGKELLGVISIEFNNKVEQSLQDYAVATAQAQGMAVIGTTTIGTDLAYECKTRQADGPGRPLALLVVRHEKTNYLIGLAGVGKAHSLEADFRALKTNWRWIPIEPSSKHLNLKENPTPLLDNQYQMRLPTIARPDRHNGPQQHLYFIDSPGMPRDVLAIEIDIAPNAAGISLDEATKAYGERIRASGAVQEAFKWDRITGAKLEGYKSQFLPVTSQMKGETVEKIIQYALFSAAPDRWLLVQCMVDPVEAKEIPRYEALTAKMLPTLGKKVKTP